MRLVANRVYTNVNYDRLEHINFKQLHTFNASYSNIESKDIRALVDHIPNLRSLLLAGTAITDDDVAYILKAIPRLEHLEISNCPSISEAVRESTKQTLRLNAVLKHTRRNSI